MTVQGKKKEKYVPGNISYTWTSMYTLQQHNGHLDTETVYRNKSIKLLTRLYTNWVSLIVEVLRQFSQYAKQYQTSN